jgi:hypothetical protein
MNSQDKAMLVFMAMACATVLGMTYIIKVL